MKVRRRSAPTTDPDEMKGAVEGDRPDQPQQGNPNAGALGENGLPQETLPICEDAIGANVDTGERMRGTAGEAVRADEAGRAPADTRPRAPRR